MKRLTHEDRKMELPRTHERPGSGRWGRFKDATVTAALLLGLSGLGACATVGTTPAPVNPNSSRPVPTATTTVQPTAPTVGSTVSVHGVQLVADRLEDSISNLEAQTRQYDLREVDQNGRYSVLVSVRADGLSASVTIFRSGAATEDEFGAIFPGGSWAVEIQEFKTMFQQQTGQELRRMQLLVQRSTDAQTREPVVSVYAIPVDDQGQRQGMYQGGYMSLGLSYYPQRSTVYGARVLLYEPASADQRVSGVDIGRIASSR